MPKMRGCVPQAIGFGRRSRVVRGGVHPIAAGGDRLNPQSIAAVQTVQQAQRSQDKAEWDILLSCRSVQNSREVNAEFTCIEWSVTNG